MLLLRALKAPVPRVVYDNIVKYPTTDIDLLFQILQERHDNRQKLLAGHLPAPSQESTLSSVRTTLS